MAKRRTTPWEAREKAAEKQHRKDVRRTQRQIDREFAAEQRESIEAARRRQQQVEEETYARLRLDDSRHKRDGHDPLTTGVARATGATARAVRRRTALTKFEYDEMQRRGGEWFMKRADGSTETTRRRGIWRRMRLRRSDGQVYLDRWGIGHDGVGRILVHRMEAPDPGVDLHDHPWWFVSIVLWGGYTEQRAEVRQAADIATEAERHGVPYRGQQVRRRWLSVRTMRLDDCHTITSLRRRTCWTLVIGGPRRRIWGFYLPTGWVSEWVYDHTVRAERRDMWNDLGASEPRPW